VTTQLHASHRSSSSASGSALGLALSGTCAPRSWPHCGHIPVQAIVAPLLGTSPP